MNYEDFIRPTERTVGEAEQAPVESSTDEIQTEEQEVAQSIELDVQKAVVESLAAEKVAQDEKLLSIEKENQSLKSEISNLKGQIAEMKQALEKVGDMLAANSDTAFSNKVSLLDRSPELTDRFEGETRDHVLEVLKAARAACEEEDRLRRAQILEAVILENEPVGTLEKKRKEIEKLFESNQNILNGQVINELDKLGITYKIGDNYLLAKEIIKRSY